MPTPINGGPLRIFFLTALAMTAFAANSILCRFALDGGLIDAASFTAIRMGSGILVPGLMAIVRNGPVRPLKGRTVWMPVMLAAYALFFSFAYIRLGAGTGALILFGAVQATMILAGRMAGERLSVLQTAGLAMALSGLVCLVFPGLHAPSPLYAGMMAMAGAAWGVYSLLGKRESDPVSATADNFILALPLVLAAGFLIGKPVRISIEGATAAFLSGALASGAGYVAWYSALKGLSRTRAAVVQLTVPVIAAIGGIILLSEPLTLRLFLSSALILSGVGLSFFPVKTTGCRKNDLEKTGQL